MRALRLEANADTRDVRNLIGREICVSSKGTMGINTNANTKDVRNSLVECNFATHTTKQATKIRFLFHNFTLSLLSV